MVDRRLQTPIVFFDGDCGLCQTCVRLLLRIGRPLADPPLYFSSLRGQTAIALLPHQFRTEPLEGLVFRDQDGSITVGIEAVHALRNHVSGPWRWAFAIFPGPVYRWIAPRRSRLGFRTCAIDARVRTRWLP